MLRFKTLTLLLAVVLAPPVAAEHGKTPPSRERETTFVESALPVHSVFVYAGQWSDNRYGSILRTRTNFRSSYMAAAGVSRVLHQFGKHLHLEGEVNAAQHWGRQHHAELNAAASLRWTTFPWDNYLDTSLAHGVGPSYAFQRPPIESRGDRRASRLLVFMVTEVAFAPPRGGDTRWEGFVRIHHRSGAYGVVSDAPGSNVITFGVRHRF